jgi:PLP dependent protein
MTLLVEPGLETRIAVVRERVAAAARRAGRDPEDVTLVAASKTWGPEVVVAGYQAGLRVFGENRVEEAGPKTQAVAGLLAQYGDSEPITWHMIGHVQSRKARGLFPWASVVHSVDGVRLARRLSELGATGGLELEILLEINVSGEASKYGLEPDAVPAAVEAMLDLPGLRLDGLMTMAPMVEDAEAARPVFRALRELQDDLARRYPRMAWRHLSMGMTDDFEVAIEEGATMVRIGRAIFGERPCALG